MVGEAALDGGRGAADAVSCDCRCAGESPILGYAEAARAAACSALPLASGR